MADEEIIPKTLLQKLLFYTTAFFVLLGTFSMFAFLFLVPFVIDPAFTTIFMQFDTNPALCVTVDTEHRRGVSNCSWTSCREGCTKDVYDCTQIRVNYKLLAPGDEVPEIVTEPVYQRYHARYQRALREYDYIERPMDPYEQYTDFEMDPLEQTGLMGNDSEWYFTGARLFPNVKGCGYPPMLNCSIFLKRYRDIGTNFTCYYSRVDPGLVISDLDMWQNTLNLVLAMAIPIPSFIISVIYLTIAYFYIYNEEPEEAAAPLGDNAEEIAGEGSEGVVVSGEEGTDDVGGCASTTSGAGLSPAEDLSVSFGHQLKVKMVDDMSRESMDGLQPSNSASFNG